MEKTLTRALASRKDVLASTSSYTTKQFNYRLLAACLLCAAAAAIFGFFLFDKGMPVAEGWYSHYAYMINEEGALPYVDFPLLFPPLYVYSIALFTKIFGYSIIGLRVLGVFIYIALAVFSCLIFYKLFRNEFLAAALGILVFAYLQSEIVQVSYDYIRFMDVCVYISIYFFLCYLQKTYAVDGVKYETITPRNQRYIISCTFFAVLASLFKQSSGLMFLLMVGVALVILLILEKDRKATAYSLLWYAIVTVAVYLLLFFSLALQGNFGAYLQYNFSSSTGAKGGIFTVLFGNIIKIISTELNDALLPTILFLLILGGEIILSIVFRKKHNSELYKMLLLGLFGTAVLVLLILCFLIPAVGTKFASISNVPQMNFLFLTDLLLFLFCFTAIIWRKITGQGGINFLFLYNYLFVSGAALLLSYAVTTSGGFAQSQLALCIGTTLGSLFYFAKFAWKEIFCSLFALIFLFTGITFFAQKIVTLYSWWGLQIGTYWEQTVELSDIDYLNGIKVSPAYAEMYNNVVSAVDENTEADDPIFVFPHIPIFYLLTERGHETFTTVQWMDVNSDEDVIADIDVLLQQPPKAIVFCHIPESVIDAHEKSFRNGEACGMRIMQDFLNEFVQEGYTQVTENDIGGGYIITTHIRN